MKAGGFSTCGHCGDRIGVYEPVVVVAEDSRRTTSLANEPELSQQAGVILMHQSCAAAVAAVAAG
jgi:hypothetical protein